MKPSNAQLRQYVAANTTINTPAGVDALIAKIAARLEGVDDPFYIWAAVDDVCRPWGRTLNQDTRDVIAAQQAVGAAAGDFPNGTPEEIGRFLEGTHFQGPMEDDYAESIQHVNLWNVDWLAVGASLWEAKPALRIYQGAA